MSALNATVARFRPRSVKYQLDSDDWKKRDEYIAEVRSNKTCSRGPGRMFWDKFAIVWLDVRDCYDMILRAERERGRTYDIVVKLRTDGQICEPWPSYDKFNWTHLALIDSIATPYRGVRHRWALGKIIHDHIGLMLRAHSDIYFGAFQELLSCSPTKDYEPHCDGYLGPECYLSKWLAWSGISFDNGRHGLGDIRYCLWHTVEHLPSARECTPGCSPRETY